jgi:hypothetical protein
MAITKKKKKMHTKQLNIAYVKIQSITEWSFTLPTLTLNNRGISGVSGGQNVETQKNL